jgi:hypothetical protein
MATDSFRRHTRTSVDVALHRAFVSLRHYPVQHSFLERLLRVVRAKSDLMSRAPNARGELAQTFVLQNLLPFERVLAREPEDWCGASGHPLAVVDSLASHLFGQYPTPRFLASVWFGGTARIRVDRRWWFVAHAGGERFRSLGLPIAMTRKMEHVFLRTPDHYSFDHALRRAEVLGLGGTPELAEVLLTTRIAEDFSNAERWRPALAWLAGCGESVDLTQIRPVVDFLHANINEVELRGRTFASVMRLVTDWHGWLGSQRARVFTWPRSRWNGMLLPVQPTSDEPRKGEWAILELLDSRELGHEGRVMRHCVSTYAHGCAARYSSIWSLRHRWCDEMLWRSVLTIEVRPNTATIVQLRGRANALPRGEPLELVRRWATREGLRFHQSVAIADGLTGQRAA